MLIEHLSGPFIAQHNLTRLDWASGPISTIIADGFYQEAGNLRK